MKIKTISLSTDRARALYRTGLPEFKSLLEENFTKEELSSEITDIITSYEAACEYMGVEVIERHILDELEIITAALNEGWEPDWNNSNEYKYTPWFNLSSGGFVFYVASYTFSSADAGHASRLCFKTKALAEFAGKTFNDRYRRLILTPPMKRL